MDDSLSSSFIETEIKLAQYYTGLRDKIGALNVAFVGFILAIYETASKNESIFFIMLLLLGFASFVSCLRAGIAYNYHFNNYEKFLKKDEVLNELILTNREIYNQSKNFIAPSTLGTSKISTLFYWAILIGSLGPIVAFSAFSPCW